MKSVSHIEKNRGITLPQEVIEKLKQAEEEIERGEVIPADVVFKELRQKYGY